MLSGPSHHRIKEPEMSLWYSISNRVCFDCDSPYCGCKGRSRSPFLCSCCVHRTATFTNAVKHSTCSFIPRNFTAGDIAQSLALLDTCVSLVGHRCGILDQRCERAKRRIANFSSTLLDPAHLEGHMLHPLV